jgi:hypothetical protein
MPKIPIRNILTLQSQVYPALVESEPLWATRFMHLALKALLLVWH